MMITTDFQKNITEIEALLPFTRTVRNNPALIEVLGALALTAGNGYPSLEDGAEFKRLEALVVTAYAVRNSDIVAELHAGGTALTDAMMPAFTGEIARRVHDLLAIKELFATHHQTEVWRRFVGRYHAMFCRGWQFSEPAPAETPAPLA
jgi:hypothetical protein